jgi:hypothetical protein
VSQPFHLVLLLALAMPGHSLTVRGYNATDHDRFTGFPADPVMNPNFIHDPAKFTGVGWWNWSSGSTQYYPALAAVSPRHLLGAAHSRPGTGGIIRFIDSAGNLITRTVASTPVVVPNDSSGASDLCVIPLSTPLPATVEPLPWLNLPGGESAYLNAELAVLGQVPNGTPRGGTAVISEFDDDEGIAENSYHLVWTYDSSAGIPGESALTPGDSGGASFGMVGGQPALVGIHSNAGTVGTITYSFDLFLPHYVSRVDDILAPSGHRLRPVNFTPTTLALPTGVPAPGTLRRRNPGAITFSLENTGTELTGNLTLTISFPAGQPPDSLSAPGWVVESGGTGVWHLRKATLAGMASQSFTANWAALPDLAAVGCTLDAGSDTAAAVHAEPSFSLAPSYAQWAHGLADPAQTADPDADGLANLLEYALGGDAESGAMELPGGHPLRPVLTESGGTVSLSYPERDDAVLRGISYLVETSTALESPWSGILPAGAVSDSSPFDPAVPGFVKRTITWPADGPRRFLRVKVELNE